MPVLTGGWLNVAFVHWPFRPVDVQALLPDALTVDTYDGYAWVSLTPFVMADLRLFGGARLPGLSAVPETNLRTYVRGPDGRDGLWFFSLEAASAALTVAARFGPPGAPYHWGRLGVDEQSGTTSYTGRRYGGTQSYTLVVRAGAAIIPSERDVWLTGRWRAYTHRLGRLLVTPVEHEPWPLAAATVDVLEQNLLRSAGLPEPVAEPLLHFSTGVVRARMGLARPVRQRPAR